MNANPTGLSLIEEGVQLLRTAPVAVFALYSAGTVPFLLSLFSFCAEMSYSNNAGDKCAASAVVVTLAYCWMKGLHAFCCRELVRAYTGSVEEWWKPKTLLAIWIRQIAFQPLGFFIKPLASLLFFPVIYVSAFFQNLTVLGGAKRSDVRKSWELARLWPKQSYAAYGLCSLLAVVVFVDLYVLAFSTPFILKSLLGIESFLTRSYTWVFSPVLLIVLAAVAYFINDLLAKAIHVIRCCDGGSLATGEDLLRRLSRLRNPVLLILAGAALLAEPARADRGSPRNASTSSIESGAAQRGLLEQRLNQPMFDRQIERVLENPEFSWRQPYPRAPSLKENSPLDRFISGVREALLYIENALTQLWNRLLKLLDLKHLFAEPNKSELPLPAGTFSALSYLLWAAFAGTLILFAVRLRKLRAIVHRKPTAPPPMPNLDDEAATADQLPEDEWSSLARRKIAAGEFRQALRALFLAILSLLASHRFIGIERWKSNSDYEKELRRKSTHRPDLLALFIQSRFGFERSWYGEHRVTPAELENYKVVYERIKHAAANNL